MSISLQPHRLKRYKNLALILLRYGRADIVAHAGLDEVLAGETVAETDGLDPNGLARELEDLGPVFVKLGQLLSTRADLLPPAYLEALGRLQDKVEPFSFADVERVVQHELGFRLSKGFASFEAEPIAAASLGQVHRASDLAMQIGEPRGKVDENALRRHVQDLVQQSIDAPLQQIQVGRVMLEITRTAGFHGIKLPAELTMLGKTLLNLDQVGRTLAPDFDVNRALREEAANLMQRRMWQSTSAANLFSAALEPKSSSSSCRRG